jgi:hypothetical protein
MERNTLDVVVFGMIGMSPPAGCWSMVVGDFCND